MKPLLKWPGGKTRLLPTLRSLLPRDYCDRWHIEPFAGGAALFFDLEPKRAILADVNRELIETYRAVREFPEEVAMHLHDFYAAGYRTHPERTYLDAREAFNDMVARRAWRASLDAARFLFLNRTCFNGLWRVNQKGEFNVPWGRYKSPAFPTKETLLEASRVLPKDLLCADFHEVPIPRDPSFIYCDPPYVPMTKTSSFTAYASDGFTENDQRSLQQEAAGWAMRGHKVMLSNSDTPLVREIYGVAPWSITPVPVRRSISAKGSARGEVWEVVIRNYEE